MAQISAADHVLVIGVGDSPGEVTHTDLFKRKLEEDREFGRVFWYTGASNLSSNVPKAIRSLVNETLVPVLLVQRGRLTGRPGDPLAEYFEEGKWLAITGEVTGDRSAKRPKVIVLHNLVMCESQTIDLGEYSTWPGGNRVLDGNAGPSWAQKAVPKKAGPNVCRLIAYGNLKRPFVAPARFA